LAGQIETPGGPDCGPRSVCWTLWLRPYSAVNN